MKKCSRCKTTKPLNAFHKAIKEKSGLASECRECHSMYRRSPIHLARTMFNNQIKSSSHRNMVKPNYTYQELYKWMIKQPNYSVLYGLWVKSKYQKMLTPSVDRLDDYKPYTLNNLRLVDWQTNKDKANKDRRNGINNKASKAVNQLNLDGTLVKKHYSCQQAARELGKNSHAAIATVCRGNPVNKKRSCGRIDSVIPKTAYGYKWEWAL